MAEQGRKMVETAVSWTCGQCPKRGTCPSNARCFNSFLVNLQRLIKRTEKRG